MTLIEQKFQSRIGVAQLSVLTREPPRLIAIYLRDHGG